MVKQCHANANVQMATGETALHLMVRLKQYELVDDIYRFFSPNGNLPNKDGDTPMHYIVRAPLENFAENEYMAKQLFIKGVDLDIRNKAGKSAREMIKEHPNPRRRAFLEVFRFQVKNP